MNIKEKFRELISAIKGFKDMTFGTMFKAIGKDAMSIVCLAGGFLMLLSALVPYAVKYNIIKGYHVLCEGLGTTFGWFIFLMTLAILWLGLMRQKLWAGVIGVLCIHITFVQGIVYLIMPVAEARIGYWLLFFGELAVIVAGVLGGLVFDKKADKPAVEEKATEVVEVTAEACEEATSE